MTIHEFIAKWQRTDLKERSAAQEHFLDLCHLVGPPTPAEANPIGDNFCFERNAALTATVNHTPLRDNPPKQIASHTQTPPTHLKLSPFAITLYPYNNRNG